MQAQFTVTGPHNLATRWEVVLTNGADIYRVFDVSKNKSKRNLLLNMKAWGEEIIKVIDDAVGESKDFDFEYDSKSKSFVFSNGFVFKYGNTVKP